MKYYIPDDSDEWEIICPTKDTSSNPELQCLGRIQGLDSMVYSTPGCNTTYGPKSNFTELVANNLTHCIDWNLFYSSCQDFGLNPNFDAISFDNSGVAFIAIFQVKRAFFCSRLHCIKHIASLYKASTSVEAPVLFIENNKYLNKVYYLKPRQSIKPLYYSLQYDEKNSIIKMIGDSLCHT